MRSYRQSEKLLLDFAPASNDKRGRWAACKTGRRT